jgi:phosphoadenosine phosphosulfate reductase
MSLEYYHKPLILTYSGGKDSQVLVQLALECLKSDEFEVLNSHTTVDAPETVYFIRDEFKKLNELGVKTTIQMPRDKEGNFISMWSLIEKKGIPPTRLARYCCQALKETSTPNRFIAVGVRESESAGRKGRNSFATRGLRKADAYYYYYYSHVLEVFEDDKKRRAESGIDNPNEVGVYDCTFIGKAKKNDDLICNPIYKWSDSEVWEYIHSRHLKYNPLYDRGFTRVGCIGCPLAGNQVQELEMYPKYKENYIRAFQKMMDKRIAEGKDNASIKDGSRPWTDGLSVYKWWVGDTSIDGQMDIFDFIDKDNNK